MSKDSSRSMQLQQRDKALLRALAETFRILDRVQINELFPMGSASRVKYRLKQLLDAGYLSARPIFNEGGNMQYGYYLGPRAAEAFDSIERGAVHRARMDAAHLSNAGLAHRMLVDSIHIRFLTAQRSNPNYRLLTWVDQYSPEWETLRTYGLNVQADGYAEYILLLHFDNLYTFFLEADRGEERGHVISAKIRAYVDFAANGAYEKRFAARRFRVLFVTTTEKRGDALAELATASGSPDLFWITSWTQLKEAGIFQRVWLRPGQQGLHSIIPHL